MTLFALPQEIAHLVTAFLALDEIVVLVGCTRGSAKTHGLNQFLPAVKELDLHVSNSDFCLRSERRHPNKQSQVPPGRRKDHHRRAPEPAPASAPSCLGRSACVYHNSSLRSLLLTNDVYASIARTKVDATEALDHLSIGEDDIGTRQFVAIDILETLQLRRQLNRFAVARTLALALRLSLHDVVEWILLHWRLEHIPLRLRADVMVASCQYDDHVIGRHVTDQLLQLDTPNAHSSGCVLVSASRHGRLEAVRSLLELMSPRGLLGEDVLQDALTAAAEGGRCDALRLIVDTAEAHAFVIDGTHALACACRAKRHEAVAFLLASRLLSISNGTFATHTSVLAAAVQGGDSEIVAAILADPQANRWDPLALQRAAGDGNSYIVKQLLKHQHCRPSNIAIALRSLPRSPAQWTLVRELVSHKHGQRLDPWELLDVVCSLGITELIVHILSTSVDVGNCLDRKYWRPLVTAARNGHDEVVGLILQGTGVWRALSMDSSLDSHVEMAEALLAACHRGYLSVVQQLITHVSLDMVQLLRIVEAAAAAPSSSVLLWLISNHDDIVCECDLEAALQYACAHGRTESARLLLSHGRVRFADGLPIQFAATCGAVDLVSLLLADPRVTPRYELEAALVDASREGHTAVVALLLADPRLEITGGTAFHEAADRGHIDVLNMLMHTPVMWREPEVLDLQLAYSRAARHGHYTALFVLLNDPRVQLPRNGVITRVDDLPKRAGDSAWCSFLRRFLRHPRVDPTADDNQLLRDACLQAKRGVVDSLLRSGRVTVDSAILDTAEDLARLSRAPSTRRMSARLARRYSLLVEDLQRHSRKHSVV